MSDRNTAVYRFYDEADCLLYVGCTTNFGARVVDHRGKPWFAGVRRITVEHFDTVRTAAVAEAAAIQTEHPRYNTLKNWATTATGKLQVAS